METIQLGFRVFFIVHQEDCLSSEGVSGEAPPPPWGKYMSLMLFIR